MMAKKKIKKTLVEQVLDTHGVPYQSLTLNMLNTPPEAIPERLAAYDLTHPQIFKTLAAKGDKTGPVIAVIPITETLDLKKLAAVSGNKKVTMLPTKELAKTGDFLLDHSSKGFRCNVPPGHASPAGGNHDIHIITVDPLTQTRHDQFEIIGDDVTRSQLMPSGLHAFGEDRT